MSIPLVIMSFNRPAYLEKVLLSLSNQNQDIKQRDIYLFQDGFISGITKRIHANPLDVKRSIEVFKSFFPWGKVNLSPVNLGVAMNFKRAETDVFLNYRYQLAYFFEDDLVLAPQYLDALDRMSVITECSPIPVGYFSAYGNLLWNAEEQQKKRSSLRRLAYHWAFGLRRDHWIRMQPLLAEYYTFLDGLDYGQRPHAAILKHFHDKGIFPNASSQDDVKKAITLAIGSIGLNTNQVFAKYIGESGVHMSPERFSEVGFDRTIWLEDAGLDFNMESNEQLEKWRQTEITNRLKNQAKRLAQAAS